MILTQRYQVIKLITESFDEEDLAKYFDAALRTDESRLLIGASRLRRPKTARSFRPKREYTPMEYEDVEREPSESDKEEMRVRRIKLKTRTASPPRQPAKRRPCRF